MLFRRGFCLLQQCAWWANVTTNINAHQAVLPTLSTQRNELWSWGPGHLQETECPEIKGALDLGGKAAEALLLEPWCSHGPPTMNLKVLQQGRIVVIESARHGDQDLGSYLTLGKLTWLLVFKIVRFLRCCEDLMR